MSTHSIVVSISALLLSIALQAEPLGSVMGGGGSHSEASSRVSHSTTTVGQPVVVDVVLPSEADVVLSLTDLSGRPIGERTTTESLGAGTHQLCYDSRNVSPGQYVLQIDMVGKGVMVRNAPLIAIR